MADLTGVATRRVRELRSAFILLTRFPVGRTAPAAPAAGAVWAYPLAGFAVGVVAAFVRLAASALAVPPFAAAVLVIGAGALLTGGLHEDGLADTVDALSGGWTVERRLLILRDSRIGAHGALALALAVLLRVAAVAALPVRDGALAILAASTLSRGAMVPVPGFCRPARPEGLGASLAAVRPPVIVVGVAIALCFGFLSGGVRALVPAVLASVLGIAVGRRRFGGFTGDLLGATAVTAECAILVALASTG